MIQTAGAFEIMRRSPLVVIDGAHNIEAFQNLRQALNIFAFRSLILVLGILNDKAAEEILQEILPIADLLVITTPEQPQGCNPSDLEAIASKWYLGLSMWKTFLMP